MAEPFVNERMARKVEWNMKDLELQRFSYEGVLHHSAWLKSHSERRKQYEGEIEKIKNSVMSYGKIVTPPEA